MMDGLMDGRIRCRLLHGSYPSCSCSRSKEKKNRKPVPYAKNDKTLAMFTIDDALSREYMHTEVYY